MNRKEMKEWVKQAIEKGYDRSDVEDLLTSHIEAGKMGVEHKSEILDIFDDEVAEVERLKIGFFERRRLKKGLKKVKEMVTKSSEAIKELTSQTKALNKKEKKQLADLKEEMIVAIVGDPLKEKEGLNNVFEVTGEDGKELTKEVLQTYEIEEIEELLLELVETLEKEI